MDPTIMTVAVAMAKAIDDSGWGFGEIVADIMTQQGMGSPCDASTVRWAELIAEWKPDEDCC